MNYADVELPSNKKFGLFFAAVFLLSSAYFANEGAYVLTLLFVVLAVTFALIAFTKSEMLLPFNRLWMRFGLLIGMIVSPIVLGAIFFVIFTPLGFVMRLFGRDELRLKAKSAVTFWKTRDPVESSAASFKNQF
tara:strand:- start:4600 stop:5001 length:402 start_codon:yes stop_codon:yes gene_type:complete